MHRTRCLCTWCVHVMACRLSLAFPRVPSAFAVLLATLGMQQSDPLARSILNPMSEPVTTWALSQSDEHRFRQDAHLHLASEFQSRATNKRECWDATGPGSSYVLILKARASWCYANFQRQRESGQGYQADLHSYIAVYSSGPHVPMPPADHRCNSTSPT